MSEELMKEIVARELKEIGERYNVNMDSFEEHIKKEDKEKRIHGKELMDMLNNRAPYNEVDMGITDEKFKDFDFEEIYQDLWKEHKEDPKIEYFFRRLGIIRARLNSMSKRLHNTIIKYPVSKYPDLKHPITGHHILCDYNSDHTFCGCGVSQGD